MNNKKLHSDFIDYYSPAFLNFLKSDVDSSNERSWLVTITRKNIISVHPIRSILFINFLFGDIDAFLNYNVHDISTEFLNKKSNELFISESYNLKKELYKNKLLNFIKQEPTLSRTQIGRKLRRPYHWLYINEKDYLESVIPKAKPSGVRKKIRLGEKGQLLL